MKSLHCTAHNVQYDTRQVQEIKNWNQVRSRHFSKNYGSDAGRNRRSHGYIMDDILIAETDAQHHDAVFSKVIERATSYTLKLNLQKCLIRQQAVPYIT